MATMNISLPDTLKNFIEERVNKDGYSTVSEYFRELVRADQKRVEQENLEALLLERLGSGTSAPMSKKDWEDIRGAVRERIAESKKKA